MTRLPAGRLLLLALPLASVPPLAMAQALRWERLSQGFNDSRMIAVAVDPRNPRLLYASSSRVVYGSEDGGVQWRQRFRAPGAAEVTWVAIDPFEARRVMAATTQGLYATADGAQRWIRIFRGSTTEEARCRIVRFHPARRHEVWLGTGGGAFVSQDGGQRWQSASPHLHGRPIRDLAFDPNPPYRLYVATDRELFVRSAEETAWQSLFSLTAIPEPSEDAAKPTNETASEDAGPPNQFTAVAVDPSSPTTLYLSSLDGAYTSADGGATWQPLTQLGLGTPSIRHLLLHHQSPTVLYAATPNGVARLRPEESRWEPLYAGLPTQAARVLAATDSRIFAATDQGLYALDLTLEQLAQGDWPAAAELLGNFVHEPTVQRVQQTAIRYAEVQPEKIATWRKQARLRALIPAFTMSGNTELGDFRHWHTGGTTDGRLDTLQKGERDIDWNANVTWDLGDFIYSDDQTNIDVRSKLMVELRDQVLDDVTRTYFERRRLQVELLTEPPSEPRAQLAKELRIQELTAVLDGLTGGWFSRQIE